MRPSASAGAVSRAIEAFSALLARISMCAIVAMMLIVVVDVVLRLVAQTSLLISDEVCGYLLVLVACFAYAEALKQDRHVRVDLLLDRLSSRARHRVDLAMTILAFASIAVVAWTSVVMVYHSYERNVLVPGVLLTPVYVPQLAMVIGLLGLLLQFFVEVKKLARKVRET